MMDEKQAMKQRAYDKFDVVNEMVADAYSDYAEGGHTLKECMMALSKRIKSKAQKMNVLDKK